jgi:hypothetical protein
MEWTEDKLNLIKAYLVQGHSHQEIATILKLTYDQVGHAIQRYNLKEGLSVIQNVGKEESRKIKKTEIDQLASSVGTELYKNYKKLPLDEPKVCQYKAKRDEVSILDLSDVHIGLKNEVFDGTSGKKLITYNEKIFKVELNNLQKSIFEIHEILSESYNLKKLVIFVTGDILTNDRIFPEQVFEIEKVVGLQLWDGVNYFTQFFTNLLKIYEEIEVVCVVGNHGRSQMESYDEPVENNFEYHLYKIWQKQFEDSKRIKIIVPTTRRYIHTVLGWKHLIEHGDSIRGFNETSIVKQIKELHLNVGGFDIFHMGHIHQIKEIEIADKVIVKINGAWIEKDNYAFRKFKTYSIPKQWFFGCNAKRPETWAYKIDLRG